jgi:DNA modification methylase
MPDFTWRPGTKRIDEMDAAPYNPRHMDEDELEKLRASIRRFGFVDPVIWNEATGHIVGGHQRAVAARLEGLEEVPVSIVDLSIEEEMLLNVALNQIKGEFVEDKLSELLRELADRDLPSMGLSLDLSGLAQAAIDDLLADKQPKQGKVPDDHFDPVTAEGAASPLTRPGDIIKLGEHLLICGDSTDPGTLARIMHGEVANAAITDPPYNVAYQMDLTDEQAKKAKRRLDKKVVSNDKMAPDAFLDFLTRAFTSLAAFVEPGGGVYIYHADSERPAFQAAMEAAGFLHKQTLVWIKSTFALGRQDHHWQHEPCLYGWRDGGAHHWYGGRDKSTLALDEGDPQRERIAALKKDQLVDLVMGMLAEPTTVFRADKPSRSEEHPTSKPVVLYERHMLNSTRPGDVVVDLFGGYGPLLIAAEKHGRVARVVELDPAYCDAMVARWEAWSGKTAER